MQDKYIWQAGWWRQKERGRWALTLALAAVLVGGGALLDREQARQEAAENAARLAEEQQSREAERLAAALLAREEAEQQQSEAEPPEQESPSPETQLSPEREPDSEAETPQPPEADYSEDGQTLRQPEPEAVRVSAGALELVMPVNGAILRGQGYDYDPSTEDYRFHRGIDLSAAAGDPVFCAAAGKVTAAAEDAYWGGVVVVDHGGGLSSAYRGLEPSVEVGQQLEAGSLLGRVLSTIPAEAAQESHIHVELSLEGDSVDPSAWL